MLVESKPVTERLVETYNDYVTYDKTYIPRNSCFTFTDRSKVSVDTGVFTPGQFRVNPYSVTKGTFSSPDQQVHLSYVNGPFIENMYVTGGALCGQNLAVKLQNLAITTPDFGNKPQIALQKALGKVGRAEYEMGVELGELRETISMLRHPMKDLRKFLLGSGQRNLRNLKKLLKNPAAFLSVDKKLGLKAGTTAANTWLEIRYGLRPLISSISSIIEQISKERDKVFNSTRIRSVTAEFTWQDTVNESATDAFSQTYCTSQVSVTNTYRVKSHVYYTMAWERTMAQTLGLSPENIPEIALELTRLSFVVDWIFSIGPWLATLRAKPGIEILGNSTSHKLTATGTVSGTIHWVSTSKKLEDGQFIVQKFHRTVNDLPPSTPLFLAATRLDLFKSIDALALILQPLLRKLR